jgi:hypothetical protein
MTSRDFAAVLVEENLLYDLVTFMQQIGVGG